MDYYRIIVNRAVLVTLVLNLMSTSPIPSGPGPWVNPCGGSNPGGSDLLDNFTGNPPDLQMKLKFIERKCAAIQQMNTKLCNVIVMTRIEDEEEAERLQQCPVLNGFPNTHTMFMPGITIGQTLVRYYNRLSIVSVFLEQAASEFSPYRGDVMGVQKTIVEMLCQLSTTLAHQEHPTVTPISRDVVPAMYRTLPNTASQDIRNFLISRDIDILIESMKIDIRRYVE